MAKITAEYDVLDALDEPRAVEVGLSIEEALALYDVLAPYKALQWDEPERDNYTGPATRFDKRLHWLAWLLAEHLFGEA